MASVPFQYTTTASTNLVNVGRAGALAASLKGWNVTNTAAYAIFVKLWWGGQGALPTVGTTVPMLTITCPAAATSGGGTSLSLPDGCTNNGQLWMWITKLAPATDSTVTVAGDGLVTLFIE